MTIKTCSHTLPGSSTCERPATVVATGGSLLCAYHALEGLQGSVDLKGDATIKLADEETTADV